MKKTIAPNEPGLPRTSELHQGGARSRPADVRSDVANLSEDALAADPYDEDLTGIPPIEPEASNQDILPDQVYRRGREPDEEEFTARPAEPSRPIPPSELQDKGE
jgi:hypothetical protein